MLFLHTLPGHALLATLVFWEWNEMNAASTRQTVTASDARGPQAVVHKHHISGDHSVHACHVYVQLRRRTHSRLPCPSARLPVCPSRSALLITPIIAGSPARSNHVAAGQWPMPSGDASPLSRTTRTARSRIGVAAWSDVEARCDGPLRGGGINEGIEDPESLIQPTVVAPPQGCWASMTGALAGAGPSSWIPKVAT